MQARELRTLNCELRAQDKMTLVGRAVTYGALSAPITNFRERVLPGAFTKSLASGTNVIADWNHDDKALPLGTTDSGTLILTDGPDGLDFRCILDPNQEAHRALYSSVARKDTKSCSWAFSVDGDGDEFDTAVDERGKSFNRRTVKQATLYGISVVNRPAYPGDATSVSARSAKFVQALFPKRKSFEDQLFDIRGYDVFLERMKEKRFALEIVNERNQVKRLEEQRLWNDLSAAGTERLRREINKRAGVGFEVNSEDGGQVSAGQQTLRCVAGSLTSSKEEHRAAAESHRCIAKRCERDAAGYHYGAADAHDDAADDDADYEDRTAALVACKRAFELGEN